MYAKCSIGRALQSLCLLIRSSVHFRSELAVVTFMMPLDLNNNNRLPSLLYLGNFELVKVYMHSVCVYTAVLPGYKGYQDVLKYSSQH